MRGPPHPGRCVSQKGQSGDEHLSISVEELCADDLPTLIKGAHRHYCQHLTVQLPPCNFPSSTLLIVQRRQPQSCCRRITIHTPRRRCYVMLRKFYSSRQPRGTAIDARGPCVRLCSTRAPDSLQRLYTLWLRGPLFSYLASTFVSGHPHAESSRLVCNPPYYSIATAFQPMSRRSTSTRSPQPLRRMPNMASAPGRLQDVGIMCTRS